MGWVGRQIGPGSSFHVLRKLSSDDLGKTFEARDKRDGALIVLKALRRSLGRNKEAVARLEAEVDAQVKLSHRGLALFRGSFEIGDTVVVYRPYAVGASLEALCSESPSGIPINRIHQIFTGLLDALAHAHDAGLSHLALSPRVIYVGPESHKSNTTIIDFGLPRIVGPTTYARIYTDSPYLAPEQRSGASQSDNRADIYAVGVLLRQAATGKTSPNVSLDAIPNELAEAIRRATASDPARRFRDARGFRRALEGRDEHKTTPHAAPAVQGYSPDEDSVDEETSAAAGGAKLAAILVRPRIRKSARRTSNRERQAQDTGNNGSMSPQKGVPMEKWAYAPTEEWAHSPTPILSVPRLASLSTQDTGIGQSSVSSTPRMGARSGAGLAVAESLSPNGNGMPTPVAGFDAIAEIEAVTEKLDNFDGLTFPSIGRNTPVDLDEFGDVEEPDDDDEIESGTFTPAFGLPVLTELLKRGNAARRALEQRRSGASDAVTETDRATEPTVILEPRQLGLETIDDASDLSEPTHERDEVRGDSVEWVLFSGDLEPVSDDDIAELERIGADDILDILAVSSPRLAISATEYESGAHIAHVTKQLSRTRRHRAVRTARKHSHALRISATIALVAAAALMLALTVPPVVTELRSASEPTGAELSELSAVSRSASPVAPAPEVVTPDDWEDEDPEPPPPVNELPMAMPPSDVLASTHLAGSLQFGTDLWTEGNTWIFHLTGAASEAGAEIDYYVTRRITAVEPHRWGWRVTVVDTGGTAEPRTTEFYASAACVIDHETERIHFCVPQEQTDLEERVAVGTAMSVFETTRGTASMLFDPNLGWVEESSSDALDRRVKSELVGYRVGDTTGGEMDVPVFTCAWNETVDYGDGIGRTDRSRPLSAHLRRAISWGLEGRLRYVDLPLGYGYGSSRLEAYYSRHQTAYLVSGGSPNQTDEAPELVELPIDQVALWRSNDDATTYVAMLFQKRGVATVRLLTFAPGEPVSEQTLMPVSELEGSQTHLYMMANAASCGIEIRRHSDDGTEWASFSLSAFGAEPLGGTL